jgi:Xaa-Pro aminopeptidase
MSEEAQLRQSLEGTGKEFSRDALLKSRELTRQAMLRMAESVQPGMSEEDARALAKQTLSEMGSHQGWHKILIRFGRNTIKTFRAPSEPGVRLGKDDIFFIDIGPVWSGTEGDAGETFTVGKNCDPDMIRCREDVQRLFHQVRKRWLNTADTGKDLYDFASQAATELGWALNLDLTGHRLSDFPHTAYYDGTLSSVAIRPSPDLWVLEIQIRHPLKPIGGFFEDLLLEERT